MDLGIPGCNLYMGVTAYGKCRRRLGSRDGPIRKFHYSAEAEYLMNATEAEASAEYFLPKRDVPFPRNTTF